MPLFGDRLTGIGDPEVGKAGIRNCVAALHVGRLATKQATLIFLLAVIEIQREVLCAVPVGSMKGRDGVRH